MPSSLKGTEQEADFHCEQRMRSRHPFFSVAVIDEVHNPRQASPWSTSQISHAGQRSRGWPPMKTQLAELLGGRRALSVFFQREGT